MKKFLQAVSVGVVSLVLSSSAALADGNTHKCEGVKKDGNGYKKAAGAHVMVKDKAECDKITAEAK